MTREAIIRHLTYYSELMIKDFGALHARIYLRGCIPIWRNAYGADVAAHMGQIIKQKLTSKKETN